MRDPGNKHWAEVIVRLWLERELEHTKEVLDAKGGDWFLEKLQKLRSDIRDRDAANDYNVRQSESVIRENDHLRAENQRLARELEQARETYGNCALQLAETQKDYAEYQSDTTRQILDLRERVGELEAEGRHDPRRLPARHLYLFTQEAVQKLIAAAKREGAHDELAEPAGMRERTRARTDGG
jgi:hypothetical protein